MNPNKTYSWAELQSLVASEARTPFLIQDILRPLSINIMVGLWGIGKSPFTHQLAVTLAAGLPTFMNAYKTSGEHLRTLYCDYENPPDTTVATIQAVSQIQGLDTPPENCRIARPDTPKQLAEMIDDWKPHFVVIDPLRIFWPTAEEKTQTAIAVIHQLRSWIKQFGITPWLIHHPRKWDGENEPPSLITHPQAFMQEASGNSALIMNSDGRHGFQESDNDVLIFRSFIRGRGWNLPLHLTRICDDEGDPIGYQLVQGINQLEPESLNRFSQLSDVYFTGDHKARFDPKPADMVVLRERNLWLQLGLIHHGPKRGQWVKVSG